MPFLGRSKHGCSSVKACPVHHMSAFVGSFEKTDLGNFAKDAKMSCRFFSTVLFT